MDECGEVIANECVEVLVQTGIGSEDDAQNNEMVAEVNPRSLSSFDILVRSAMALEEEDPRAEHSYACGEKRHAVQCKEKDHCYSSSSKHRNGPRASLSDENIYLSSESISENTSLLLPHYQSKDSALDVTGFDTISEKCLSYENIDMKTVDVFTELLPSTSAPDVSFSRMSLQNQNRCNEMNSTSLPTSPCSKSKGKLTLDHTYSSIKMYKPKRSPLFDHSYNSKKWSTVGMKRGRSTEEINFINFDSRLTVKSIDFTKSPFLDHSYQSLEIKTRGKKFNKGFKASMNTRDKVNPVTDRGNVSFPQPRSLDHTYEKLIDKPCRSTDGPSRSTVSRSRSNSLSSNISRLPDMKVEHSYVSLTSIEDAEMKDICSTVGSLSDSGTESLNDEDDNTMLTTTAGCIAYPDHSYVPQGDTHA